MTVLPVDFITWCVDETLQLADSLGKHRGIILLVDDPIAKLVLLEKRRTQPVIPEPTSAFPAYGFRDTSSSMPSITFFIRGIMCVWQCSPNSTMIHRRPILCPAAPVVPETSKGVEHPVTWIRSEFENSLDKFFWFWSDEQILNFSKQGNKMFLSRLVYVPTSW